MGDTRQIRTVPHNPTRARDSTNVRTMLSPGQMDFAVGVKEGRTAVIAVPSDHQGCCHLHRPVEIVCGDHPCDGRRKRKRQLRNRPRSLQRTRTATRRVAPSWRPTRAADGGNHDASTGLQVDVAFTSRRYTRRVDSSGETFQNPQISGLRRVRGPVRTGRAAGAGLPEQPVMQVDQRLPRTDDWSRENCQNLRHEGCLAARRSGVPARQGVEVAIL